MRDADLIEDAKTMTTVQIAKKYGVGRDTVLRKCRKLGVMPVVRYLCKSPPDGFMADAKTMSLRALAAKYQIHERTVKRMIKALGVERSVPIIPRRKREIPEGFAAAARTMTFRQIEKRFNISAKVAARMIREMGIRRQVESPIRAPNKLITSRRWIKAIESHNTAERTPDSIAADYLRAFEPVSRCDDNSKFDPHGRFWHIRGRRVTGDELIEMADSKRERLERRAQPMQPNYFSL